MKRTGEQVIATEQEAKEVYGDIEFRYGLATPYAQNKEVLDIACGTGIGTINFSSIAKNIVGMDYGEEVINYAKKNFKRENITYIIWNAEKVFPFEDNTVDLITAFEFIEHIKGYKHFLKECNRVLKPGGVMVLTTPNAKHNKVMHMWHVQEFTNDELKQLLKGYFPSASVNMQGIMYKQEFLDRLHKAERTSGLVSKTPSFIKNMIPSKISIWISKILGFNATKNDFFVTTADEGLVSFATIK